MDAHEVIKAFQLRPHPREDGFYRETYRSSEMIPANNEQLPTRYKSAHCFSTAILFLISAGKFSAFHRLQSDEIFHFYVGGPAELVIIHEDGSLRSHMLGTDFSAGEEVQVVVPKNTWQALKLKGAAPWILVGCTVAPGFEFDDFEDGYEPELVATYPQHSKIIEELAARVRK